MKNRPYPLNVVPQISNLKEMVEYCEKTYKNATAFQFEKNNQKIKISFEQFHQDITTLGTILYSMRLKQNNIALIGENSYEWIVSYFATVNGGNIIVPINHGISEDELISLLLELNISTIFVSDKFLDIVQKIKKCTGLQTIICMEQDIPTLLSQGATLLDRGERSFIDYSVQEDVCCTILYTSGTAGKPKGVMLSHKNIVSDTIASIKNVYFAGTSILVLPLYHSFAFTASVLCILISGRTISINQNLKNLRNDFNNYQPQNLILVPMIVESLYKQIWMQAKKNRKDCLLHCLIMLSNCLLKLRIDLRKKLFSSIHNSFGGKLDFIISGGAPIPNKYVKGFRDFGIQILNGYGITECSPVLAVNRNNYFRDYSVGQVLDGIHLKIIDGEILVKGDVVTTGYYNNVQETSLAFQDGWFNTGDLGYLDNNGFLYITGRRKNLIILSDGKNVSPEELEDHFYRLDYVKEVIVYQKGEHIEAEVYIGEDRSQCNDSQIKQDLKMINNQLPKHKNISKVIIRQTEFPKTSTKKIRRITSNATTGNNEQT